ncbi:MAG: TonB-dependent receptor plug domain-containing protein [Salinarimonas sp.]
MRLTELEADVYRILFAAGAFALAGTAIAQSEEGFPEAGAVIELDQILVTDGLTGVEQRKSGRSFTVISGEQLQRNQVRYVADALRQVPGFAVSRTGGHGGFTQLRVRGAEGNHVLVLVDGVEMSETSSGEFDFGSLVVDDIERIEVLRGPQSAFWGSNALAGVVNIITRRGERGDWRVHTRSEVGTDGTALGGLGISGGGDNYDLALSGLFRRNDGFNISSFGTGKDGDRNATLNGRLTIDVSPDLQLDANLRYVDRRSDTDPQDFTFGSPTFGRVIDGNAQTATRELFGAFGATLSSLDGALTQRIRFSGSDTERRNFRDGLKTTWTEGDRQNLAYRATYRFDTPAFMQATHRISGGYEWQRENFRPSHLQNSFSRKSQSLITEYRGEFYDQLFLTLGARHDFNDRFRDATTWSAAASWQIPNTGARLHASAGTGITNPTFFEQFGFAPDRFIGNPRLVPERSFGWDIGLEQTFFGGMLIADITYFNQNLTREIATLFLPNAVSTPFNRSGISTRQGVEISANFDFFNGLTANASYTYLEATEQTLAAGPRQVEVRRPRHSGAFGVAWQFDQNRARLFADVVLNGRMQDVAFVPNLPPRVTLPAYAVLNVGGSYRFNDRVELYGRIENATNTRYQEVFDFKTPGRTAFIGIRGTF